MKKIIFIALLVFVGVECVEAQRTKVTFANIFTNGVVLQRETTVPIWGWGPKNTELTIEYTWGVDIIKTSVDENEKWMAYLPTPQAGGPYQITVRWSNKLVRILNVMIGEVWICSGQSNMKMRLGEADMWTVQDDNNTNIRFFEVPVVRENTPQDEVQTSSWRSGVISGNMQHISAVGYYFARRLQQELNVPVGMIGVYEGGTNAEEWTEKSIVAGMPDVNASYTDASRPAGCLYNGMINPIIPYKVSGVIWYQGENNVSRQGYYSKLLNAMVEGWRADFNDGQLPFYLVQLTSFSSDWKVFREIQENIAASMTNSGMVVTTDVGDNGDIHPKNKYPVGTRLGDLALAKVYGKTDFTYSSPLFREVKREDSKMRVFFDYAEKGLKLTNGESPYYFEIAASDGVYRSAEARIEGNTVLVWSDQISEPASVRYFWLNYGEPNLFTTDGYPVAPFRSKK